MIRSEHNQVLSGKKCDHPPKRDETLDFLAGIWFMTKKNKNLLFAWGAGAIKFYESPVLVVLLLVTSLHDKKYCVNPRYVMEFYNDCPQDCQIV